MPDTDQTDLDAVETELADAHARYVARGREIISTEMARARQMASDSPHVAALIPHIENALHNLFSHLVTSPLEYADHQRAVAETAAADAAAAEQTEPPTVAEVEQPAPPSKDDIVL